MTTTTCLLTFLLTLGSPAETRATRAVGDAYLATLFGERDLAAAEQLLAEDVFFIDPTADVWGGALATGIRGREQVMAMKRSFGAVETDFRSEIAFGCGPYAVYAGKMNWTSTNAPPIEGLAFVTILEVEDGKIASRRDFGDYDTITPGFVTDPNLAPLARDYLKAYAALDVERLRAYWHDDVAFQDPTSTLTGDGLRAEGIDAVAAKIEGIVSSDSVLEFIVDPSFEFFSNHHAVFAGTTRYTLRGRPLGLDVDSVTVEQPIVVALEIRSGRVREHWDFTDYTLFLDELAALRAQAEEG